MPKRQVLVLFDIDGTLLVNDKYANRWPARWIGSSKLWRLTLNVIKTMAKISGVEVKLGLLTYRGKPDAILNQLVKEVRQDASRLTQNFVAYLHSMKLLYESLAKPIKTLMPAAAASAASGFGGDSAAGLVAPETQASDDSSPLSLSSLFFTNRVDKGYWLSKCQKEPSLAKPVLDEKELEAAYAEAEKVLPKAVLPEKNFFNTVRKPADIKSFAPSDIIVLDDTVKQIISLSKHEFEPVLFESTLSVSQVHYSVDSICKSLKNFFTRCHQRFRGFEVESTKPLSLASILTRLKAHFGISTETQCLENLIKDLKLELETMRTKPDAVDGVMSYHRAPTSASAKAAYETSRIVDLQAIEAVYGSESGTLSSPAAAASAKP